MKKTIETVRFFFFSIEFIIVICGVLLNVTLSNHIDRLLSNFQFSDDLFKWIVAIPGVLLAWSFSSGRKVLFPEKDKSSILQKWPDYWRLKAGFHVALAWNVIFTIVAAYAWIGDWKKPSSTIVIALGISVIGSSVCSLSLYNAQTRVEEEVSQYEKGG